MRNSRRGYTAGGVTPPAIYFRRGGQVYIGGVSCATATACTAVGYVSNGQVSNRTLAEAWNGTTWTVQPTPVLTRNGPSPA